MVLALCIAAAMASPGVRAAPDKENGRPGSDIHYQIFVRSFRDTNGDRVGDLDGVTRSLGYLRGLHVGAIILTPVQASPFYHNYFATDFTAVDGVYGGEAALRRLVRAAHARRMRVILDEEFQYVAEGHPWWRDTEGKPGAAFGDFILYNRPSANEGPEPFLGQRRYQGYDRRTIGIAMVDMKNPAVRSYFSRLLLHWVDPYGDGSLRDGVDGFRIDHMMDDLDDKHRETNLFADFWTPVFAAVRERNPNVELIAEQSDWGYGADWLKRGGVDAVFAFPLRRAIAGFDKAAIVDAITRTDAATPPGRRQLVFVENHDMDRLMSVAAGDPAKARLAAVLNLTLRGEPLIYYGQELGMRGQVLVDTRSDGAQIPVREAFRWRRDLAARGSATWYQGDRPWWTYRANRSGDGVSVEEEAGDPASLLNLYRTLAGLRQRRTELASGEQTLTCPDRPSVLCVLRTKGDARTLVLANLGAEPTSLTLRQALGAREAADPRWIDLLARNSVVSGQSIRLRPWGVRAFGTP